MKTLYLLVIISTGLFLVLAACSTPTTRHEQTIKKQHASLKPITQATLELKNPLAITLYSARQPLNTPYIILGKATISKYNLGGIKRQEACLNDAMRKLAASMGGDAVINLNKDDKTISGLVIAYQNT
ncbi:MAG: hypothetical protein K0S27_310 [Gammaproteobacteria bacterium]|jgi:hypothetical protein|nr:hypothetical protein [Gammaproteobacteria bacterium]